MFPPGPLNGYYGRDADWHTGYSLWSQDFPRAEFGGPPGPVHRVDPGTDPAAVRGYLEEAGGSGSTARVHGQHHALRPEPAGGRYTHK